jgi:hypothetical protein
MPFALKIEPDLIRITLSGVVTDADLQEMIRASDEFEREMQPILPRITDARGALRFAINYEAIRDFAEHRSKKSFPNAFKSAILVNAPVQMGMGRMFQTLNDNPLVQVEIFEDEAKAIEWLKS